MARVVNTTDSVYVSSAAGLTYSVLIGSNAENDLVLVKISTSETSALGAAPASWTALGTQGASQGCRSAWYYRVAPAGGIASPVSFTVPNGHTIGACVVVRGANTTPTLEWQRFDWGNSTNIATAASTSVTASSEAANAMITPPDKALLLYSFTSDGSPYLRSSQNELMSLSSIRTNGGQVSQAIGYRQHSTGTLPVVNYYASLATEGGNMWVISIADDGTGILDRQWLSGGDEFFYAGDYGEALFPFGTSTNAASTIDDAQGAPPALPSLGGYDLSSTAAALNATNVAFANSLNGTGTRIRTALASTPTVWQGLVQTLNANKNMENKIFAMHYIATVNSATPLGSDGMALAFADAEGDWTAYRLATEDGLAADTERVCFISLGYGTELGSGLVGAMNWADIDKIGYLIQRTGNDATALDLTIKNLMLLGTATITGGYSAVPATFQWSYTPAGSWSVYDTQRLQGSAQSMVNWPLQIGDGTAKTYFKASASAYTTPSEYSVASRTSQQDWNVPAGKAGITVYAADGDTMDFSGALLSNSVLQPFTIHASSSLHATTTYSFVGATFSGFTIADNAGLSGANAWTSVSMLSGGKHVFANGADLTNCTIKPGATLGDAACSFTADGSVLTGCTTDVSGTDATYHGELASGVKEISLVNHTFTDNAATDNAAKIHVLKTAATVAAGAFVTGDHYEIKTVGTTDFTLIGASANTIGVRFTATGAGSGTGDAYAAVKITISGTTTLAEADVTSAGAVVWVAAPQPTLSATVLANTRCLLWNRTTSAELDNAFVAGTTWSKVISSGASSSDVLDLYTFKEGYAESVATIIYAGANASFAVSQATDAAIQYYRTQESITDYTTLTEFNFYAPDIYIQSDDPDGESTLKKLFIFYNGVLTTADGATYMRGGVTFNSAFDVIINRSVRAIAVDNVSVTHGLHFTDEDTIRVTTDDGTSWIAPPSAPGSIRYAFGVSPGQIETGVSGLTGPESTQLMGLSNNVNVVSVAGLDVTGSGTQADPWGPV